MSEKRFIFELVEISDVDNDKLVEVITDKEKNYSYGELDEVVFVLNEQQATIERLEEENEQLKIRLLNCEQKNNGGFQVWEVPPLPKGMRIKISTGEKDE